jgi:protein TonB
MIMNWHKRSWLEDRFMLFLVLATALHALLLLGVSFGVTLKPSTRLADTLEVVLVKWRSEKAPEEADFLAQASQQGGGEVTEKSRPSQPVSGEAPTYRTTGYRTAQCCPLDATEHGDGQSSARIEQRSAVEIKTAAT